MLHSRAPRIRVKEPCKLLYYSFVHVPCAVANCVEHFENAARWEGINILFAPVMQNFLPELLTFVIGNITATVEDRYRAAGLQVLVEKAMVKGGVD